MVTSQGGLIHTEFREEPSTYIDNCNTFLRGHPPPTWAARVEGEGNKMQMSVYHTFLILQNLTSFGLQ